MYLSRHDYHFLESAAKKKSCYRCYMGRNRAHARSRRLRAAVRGRSRRRCCCSGLKDSKDVSYCLSRFCVACNSSARF